MILAQDRQILPWIDNLRTRQMRKIHWQPCHRVLFYASHKHLCVRIYLIHYMYQLVLESQLSYKTVNLIC